MRLIFRPRSLGVAFLALLVFAVWLTYAIFTKKFTDYEKVTLQTSNIGLNLPDARRRQDPRRHRGRGARDRVDRRTAPS